MKKKLLLCLCTLALVGCAGGEGVASNSNANNGNPAVNDKVENNIPRPAEGENLQETEKVRIHYARNDAKYDNWCAWIWQKAPQDLTGHIKLFDKSDEIYGNYLEVDIKNDEFYKGATRIGFICIKLANPGDANNPNASFPAGLRDISSDRFIDIPEQAPNGIHEVYLYEGVSEVMDSLEQALKDKIVSSDFTDKKTISTSVILSSSVPEVTKSMVHLYKDGEEITDFKFTYDNKKFIIELTQEADITKTYTVKVDFPSGALQIDSGIGIFYDDPDFVNNFTYYGDDLGVTFNSDHTRTTFKLWAPISSKVVLNLYEHGTPDSYDGFIRKLDYDVMTADYPTRKIEMKKLPQGVWSVTLPENFHGKYYTYSVTNGGTTSEVVDPYAKTCGIDGLRGQVVDFDKIDKEVGWEGVTRPDNIENATDATIYEAHVRDLTIDSTSGLPEYVEASYQGKTIKQDLHGNFLGLAQKGTTYTDENGVTVKTGLDHIKELGVSHIQLQPIYDYASVDEAAETKYNWGYDPQNYNCLEGSYSTNPYDGLVRVKEFKQLMKTLCEEGINVNMDVVFNHTYASSETNFEKIIPGYYHRMKEDGTFSDGAGCGNEMATERPMYRKFVVDSCKFWVDEYNISGFRFDLMKLLDTTTMELVYTECAKIYEDVMVYGEPWSGGTSLDTYTPTDQATMQGLKGVGGFNDHFRDAMRGNNDPGKGWIQDSTKGTDSIIQGIWGQFSNTLINPLKTVNYVSCHDNYALFDQIDLSINTSLEDKINKVEQAQAMVFLAEGVPFMHGGEEMLRTKQAGEGLEVHNSYNAGDEVNKFDYSLKIKNSKTFEFIKDIIAIRNEFKGFRLPTYAEISRALTINKADSVIDYTINYDGKTYRVVSNSGSSYNVPDITGYQVAASNTGKTTLGSSLVLGQSELIVLVK